jgi:hypothetical protein
MQIKAVVLLGGGGTSARRARRHRHPLSLLGLTQPAFEGLLDESVLDLGGQPW